MGAGGGQHPSQEGDDTKMFLFSFKNTSRKIKTLGEDDPWLDDAAAWIERSRKLQQEKELAEKRVGGGTHVSGAAPQPCQFGG